MSIQAINVRNQFRAKVKAIIDGPVVSEVEVVALVKATEVSIAKI